LIDQDTISTGTPGLDVEYVRNLEQSKVWRKHPLGAHLGRSDLEGLLGDLDAYDKTYTSLMRDLEDGKSRLLVAESMLQTNGPGQGAVFRDSSLFTGLNNPPGKADTAKMPIEQVQFKIRVDEHLRIMEDILHRIVRSAGYSPRSFGLAGEHGATDKTATEVSSEDSLSQQTRKRKIRAWEPAIERLLRKCLAIDAVLLNGGGDADPKVDVQFASASRQDPLVLAQIVQTLRNAKAASTETMVRIVNPSADEQWIEEEVAKIMAEDELPPVEDPDTFRPPEATLEA
jgi:A118 family predicted phage portal protein